MDEHFEHSVDYELLSRYFTAEGDAGQRAAVKSWIDASAENRATYEALVEIWEKAEAPSEMEAFETDSAWNKVKSRMQESTASEENDNASVINMPAARRSGRNLWRMAAILVLGFGMGLFFLTQRSSKSGTTDPHGEWVADMTSISAENGTKTFTLTDGSTVTLAPHSELSYPRTFHPDRRDVQLRGKAFFEIARNVERPFTISAGEAEVKVLGTSFLVEAMADSVDVTVKSGKVSVRPIEQLKSNAMLLEAGEKGRVTKGQTIQLPPPSTDNYLFFKDRKLSFRATPLRKVIRELEKVYDVEISVQVEKKGTCRLKAEFENETIAFILNVIAENFNLEVTQNENNYFLHGEGCD